MTRTRTRQVEERLLRSLDDLASFSQVVAGVPLRDYQLDAGRAILESVHRGAGQSFTVMFARQMGKNELSAHLEALLLIRNQREGGVIIKAAPTFQPQGLNSKLRLERALGDVLPEVRWEASHGHVVHVGKASCAFFSASPGAHVVGATASLLLEIDEAQDVDVEKYSRDFRPMASTTNATTVLYGTAWSPETLLARQRAANADQEQRDGVRRNFRNDWTALAAISPAYKAYVEAEIARLGATHPAIRTQYFLEDIDAEGRFFSPTQLAQLSGTHARQRTPRPGSAYVAGIDLAGPDETAADATLRAIAPRKDSTVVTIAEIDTGVLWMGPVALPSLRVVEHYWWTGHDHLTVGARLQDLLFGVWDCRRVVVDATGVGAGIASWLLQARGPSRVTPFVFSRSSKSDLAYELLGMVNTGRFKVYAADDSPEHRQWRTEADAARYRLYANQAMDFSVPPDEGHDDFVISAALCAWAARDWSPRAESAAMRPKRLYGDEGRY